jgi:hypothetical protein
MNHTGYFFFSIAPDRAYRQIGPFRLSFGLGLACHSERSEESPHSVRSVTKLNGRLLEDDRFIFVCHSATQRRNPLLSLPLLTTNH